MLIRWLRSVDIALRRKGHEPVACEVDCERVGASQRHRAEFRADRSRIRHIRCDERDKAALAGRDTALIDDRCVLVAALA